MEKWCHWVSENQEHNKRNTITFYTGTADVDERCFSHSIIMQFGQNKRDDLKRQQSATSLFLSPILWLGPAVIANTLWKHDFNNSLNINFHKIYKKLYQAWRNKETILLGLNPILVRPKIITKEFVGPQKSLQA